MVSSSVFSCRAPTVRHNGVKNDARMGAPASARMTEAQMIRTGKPETASPAVEGPTKDKREKQTLPTPTPRAEKGQGTGRRKDRNMHSKNNTKTKFSTYVYVHTRLIHSSRIDEVPEHVVWILPTLPAGEPTVRVVVVRLIAHRFVPVIIPISGGDTEQPKREGGDRIIDRATDGQKQILMTETAQYKWLSDIITENGRRGKRACNREPNARCHKLNPHGII